MIFSIAMGAEYSFYMKSIETHARAFLTLIILSKGTVVRIMSLSVRHSSHARPPLEKAITEDETFCV